MSADREEAVDVGGIAHFLNTSKESVYRKAVNVAESEPESWQIPGFKIGTRWKFFPSTVREHLTKPVDPWAYLPAAKAKLRRAS